MIGRKPRLRAAAFALAAIGCNPLNPFDPEIPSGAFNCDPVERVCPAGQECKRDITGGYICVSEVVPPDGLSPPADAAPPSDGAEQKEGPVHLDGAVFADAGGCVDAGREPNNSSTAASLLSSLGTNYALEICYPGDVDHMSFTVPVGERLRATIQFSHAEGDLDAALLDPNGATIDESKGFGDTEVLQMGFSAPTTDRYIIGVVGFQGAVNTYSLLLELD